MQIRSMMSYLYYKLIEKDINKELENNTRLQINRDFIPKDYRMTSFGEYDEYVEVFKEVFKESFPKKYYKQMMSRIESLTIKKEIDKPSFLDYISAGYYNSRTNQITLIDFKNIDIDVDKEEVLMHELLHMASTISSNKGVRTGFDLDGLLGVQLNEGYTEYLTKKYFTRKNNYTKKPEKSIILAKGIENIIGSEKMEKYYFEADINSIINELSKYISRKEAIVLLYLMDRVSDIYYNTKDFDYLIREITKINKTKLDKDLEDGKITSKEYDEEYAIKVKEYRQYQLWSEKTRIIGDDNSFILEDNGNKSRLYERNIINQTKKLM